MLHELAMMTTARGQVFGSATRAAAVLQARASGRVAKFDSWGRCRLMADMIHTGDKCQLQKLLWWQVAVEAYTGPHVLV